MHVLVTGAAGFIGFHLSLRLLEKGHSVVGVDNLNDYYDGSLKQCRLEILRGFANFTFSLTDLADDLSMENLFSKQSFSHVVHLAAQAGVRYSIEHPRAYGKSNLNGFLNVLEGCRESKVDHLIYASSSSVYGLNTKMPFSEQDPVDHPVSLYGATKKSNELMAHAYSHLYGLPCTGLRFFTVYGPWGRPDMALFLFTKAILEGRPIKVFNNGRMERDFTYIDDIVEGVLRVMPHIPEKKFEAEAFPLSPAESPAPWRIYNIGNNKPVRLDHFISVLEESLGKKAIRDNLPMQPGDVYATYADISSLNQAVGFTPTMPIEEGIPKFVSWYREYYKV